MMDVYAVGAIRPEIIGLGEGVHASTDDSGILIIVHYGKPTKAEIDAFDTKNDLHFGYFNQNGVFFFLLKPGNLPWMDAPFNPRLQSRFSMPKAIPDGFGISLTIVLADSDTGEIKAVRYGGLNTELSRSIAKDLDAVYDANMPNARYTELIVEAYTRYNTLELVDRATVIAKFKKEDDAR